jgi:class 3 adenylate cyclase/tetratricopeptide (TPR) repeat protein
VLVFAVDLFINEQAGVRPTTATVENTLNYQGTQSIGDAITPYLAPFVWRRVEALGALTQPESATAHGAAMLADVSGFTALTETLAEEGVAGAERLRDLINGCFSPLVDTVIEHGGEVVHFAGDAVLAVWFSEFDEDVGGAAARCAEEIRRSLDGRDIDSHRVRLRIGVGCGAIDVSYVGGVEDRWECLVSGSAVEQSVTALLEAPVGSVKLSLETRGLIKEPTNELVASLPLSGTKVSVAQEETRGLRAFVPSEVLSRIDAGQADWLAEFRQVTTLFANLEMSELRTLELLQTVVAGMQAAVYDYDGSVLQVLVEDKGLTLLAAWGTSLHFHEDNATRAMRAAREIESLLKGIGLRCRLGLTTGTVFLGVRGNETRKEFAVVGDVVNLAARLMQASQGPPLCDATTRAAARQHFVFEALPAIVVKGKLKAVSIYEPTERAQRRTDGLSVVVGRERETGLLSEALVKLESSDEGRLVFIEGQPGIGKSNLIGHLLEETQSSTVRSLVAKGDPLEKSTTYQPWQSIFERLMGLTPNSSVGERDEAAVAHLEFCGISTELAPLLNSVVDCNLGETEVLLRMSPLGRAERTREILIGILGGATRGHPTLLVCEDLHWFDSASLALVSAVLEAFPGMLCVLAARESEDGERAPELRQLAERESALRIGLAPLSKEGSLELICSLLNVDLIPQQVIEWIYQQAGGHPLFTEQLAFALRDEGLIRIEHGEIHLRGSPEELHQLTTPDTVQNLVTSRIDRLPPDEQLLLKVASIAGNSIEAELLVAIYPVDVERALLEERLQRLCELGWLDRSEADRQTTFHFGHAVSRDIAYESLSFAQRRQLHGSVAQWLESRSSSAVESPDAILAHHWSFAGLPDKAFASLERAGMRALRDHANVEAVYFFAQAIELERSGEAAEQGMDSLRHARWHRLLGDACIRMWDIPRGVENLECALAMLGRPIPSTNLGRARLLAGQLLLQAGLQLRIVRGQAAESEKAGYDLEASAAAALMSFVGTHRRMAFETIAFGLLAANLSERAGAPNPRALALLGIAAGALGLGKLARRYFDRSHVGARSFDQLQDLPQVLVLYSSFLIGEAELEQAEALLAEGLGTAEQTGDRESIGDLLVIFGNAASRRGEFSTFRERVEQGFEVMSGLQSESSPPYLKIGLLHVNAQMLSAEEAYLYLVRVRDDLRAEMNDNDKLLLLSAQILARAGHVASACAAADEAMGYLAENFRMVPGVCWMVLDNSTEAYLECCELLQSQQIGDASLTDVLRKARKASGMLSKWSRLYRVSEARALLMRGRVESLSGRHSRAAALWERSLEVARGMQLPLDEAFAQLELGRHDIGDAHSHLDSATEAFAGFKMPFYLERSQQATAKRDRSE